MTRSVGGGRSGPSASLRGSKIQQQWCRADPLHGLVERELDAFGIEP